MFFIHNRLRAKKNISQNCLSDFFEKTKKPLSIFYNFYKFYILITICIMS